MGLKRFLLAAVSIPMAALATSPASALTADEYVEMTVELGQANYDCKLEADPVKFSAISQAFYAQPGIKRYDIEARISKKFSTYEERVKQMGKDAFCASIVAKYGPQGTKQKDLLWKPPG